MASKAPELRPVIINYHKATNKVLSSHTSSMTKLCRLMDLMWDYGDRIKNDYLIEEHDREVFKAISIRAIKLQE